MGDELAELVTAVNVHAPFVKVIDVGNYIVKVDEVGIAWVGFINNVYVVDA